MNPVEFYMQVYGLESVIAPAVYADASAEPQLERAKTKPWILFSSDLTVSEFEVYREMFDKITVALGLKDGEFVMVLQDAVPAYSSQSLCVSVSFGGAQMGWSQSPENSSPHVVVSSFTEMAQNPELKKSAWSFLKKILDFRPAF